MRHSRKRLDELRAHEGARRSEALRARQLAEVLAVEEGHVMEFQQFNAVWDAKMGAFELNAENLMQAMRVRAVVAGRARGHARVAGGCGGLSRLPSTPITGAPRG